jgi:hypothetical protein
MSEEFSTFMEGDCNQCFDYEKEIDNLNRDINKLRNVADRTKSLLENLIFIHDFKCIGSSLCHVDLNCVRCILEWCIKMNKEALK